jgi:5'(3')-deoxyribonucleotidase
MNPNKESLLLDQDGVLADTMGAVMQIVEDKLNVRLCHADIHDYWFKNMIVPSSAFVEALRTPGLYRNLDVITGAVRGVNRLRERYNDNVFVVTAPMNGCEASCEDEKREWLEQHFDRDFAERAVVTDDKTLIPGRVLIEDNPDIPRNAIWQPILFDQAWNHHVADLPVMRNWVDLEVIYVNYKESGNG